MITFYGEEKGAGVELLLSTPPPFSPSTPWSQVCLWNELWFPCTSFPQYCWQPKYTLCPSSPSPSSQIVWIVGPASLCLTGLMVRTRALTSVCSTSCSSLAISKCLCSSATPNRSRLPCF